MAPVDSAVIVTDFLVHFRDLRQASDIIENSCDEVKLYLCKSVIIFIQTVINNEVWVFSRSLLVVHSFFVLVCST